MYEILEKCSSDTFHDEICVSVFKHENRHILYSDHGNWNKIETWNAYSFTKTLCVYILDS